MLHVLGVKRLLVCLAILSASFLMLGLSAQPAEADTKDRIIKIARKYLGTNYSRMNCSEFTSKVYKRAVGVYMPAWDDKQLAYGWSVRNVKRGDLMFFREYGGHGRVTHVGIYYGRGRIIHSSSYFNEVVISEVQYIENNFDNHRIR